MGNQAERCSICGALLSHFPKNNVANYWDEDYLCPDCYDFIDVEADRETDTILLKKLKFLVARARKNTRVYEN